MDQNSVLKLAYDMLKITLMVSGPLLITSIVVGLIVSITQVVTSIQDMTMTFVPKIIAVLVVFLLVLPWIMRMLVGYTAQLFGQINQYAL
jgi:flagellar biosynthetic protein FliQ